MRWFLVCITLWTLMAAPPAAAGGDVLVATSVAAGGDVGLVGALAGAAFSTARGAVVPGEWAFSAADVQVTYETLEGTLFAPGASLRTDAASETRHASLTGANIRFEGPQSAAYVYIFAERTDVEVQASSLDYRPVPSVTLKEPFKYADQQPALSDTWTDALSVAGEGLDVVLRGDFTMAVWGVDVGITYDDGREAYPTGPHGGDRSAPAGSMAESWLYLDVRDATFRVPAADVPHGSLIVEPGSSDLHVVGSVYLTDAEGTIGGHALTEPSDIGMVGEMRLVNLDVDAYRLHVRVDGEPQSLTVAARYVAMQDDVSRTWLWWSGFVALAAAFGVVMWQRRPTLERLHRDLAYGRYTRVLRDGRRRLSGPSDTPARIAVSVALVRSGRPAEALRTIREGNVPGAPRALVEAHALSLLGQEPEARRLLAGALRQAPHLEDQVRCNPALARLRDTPGAGGYA